MISIPPIDVEAVYDLNCLVKSLRLIKDSIQNPEFPSLDPMEPGCSLQLQSRQLLPFILPRSSESRTPGHRERASPSVPTARKGRYAHR